MDPRYDSSGDPPTTGDLPQLTPRIWTKADASKGQPSLVRLTASTLSLAEVPRADLEEVIDDLESGGDVAGLVIPIASVVGARGDEDGGRLTVRFQIGRSKVDSREIVFVDKAERDEFVESLVEALGPGWATHRKPVSRWTAGFWTLGPTVIAALITWGLHAEASLIARGRPPLPWGKNGKLKLLATAAHWIERQLGPTGILIAGGVLVAVGLVLFMFVMAVPPTTVVVEPLDPSS